VIGIIAILIGLLLPALNKARKQAFAAQCSSNMRQIAMAILTYSGDNRGVLIPELISDNYGATKDPTNPYVDGWFWAGELMNQHYLAAPNILTGVVSGGIGKAPYQLYNGSSSVFQCPAALTPSDKVPGAGTSATAIGSCSTDQINSVGVYGMASDQRTDGAQPYATATWYQLVAITTAKPPTPPVVNADFYPGGANTAPFVDFDVKKGALGGPTGQLANGGYRRVLSQIRHSALMAMLVESGSAEWLLNGANVTPNSSTLNGETIWMQALAARHGQVSNNGNNASTNIAFFDGHVDSFSTQTFNDYVNPATNMGGATNIPQSLGAVFTLTQDQ